MSRFTLHPATIADATAVAAVEFEACQDDPGFSTIWPAGATPSSLQWATEHFRHDLHSDPACRVMVVKPADRSEVASFAQWYFFDQGFEQDHMEEEILTDEFGLPADANVEAGNRLIAGGIRKRHEIMGLEPYAYFSAMGTATKYRNQGAASMLMETFVAEVDRRGLRAYVEGTAAALGVYKKYGFEEVDHLKLDLKPWKTGEYFNVCMFRPAQQNATGSR